MRKTKTVVAFALGFAICSCAHSEKRVTVCSPERFTDMMNVEVHSFECTPPPPDADYSLNFEQGMKRLVCLPLDDYAKLKTRDCE